MGKILEPQLIAKKLPKYIGKLKQLISAPIINICVPIRDRLLLKDAIKEHKLTGVVVAACSPRMHEPTFSKACAEAGLNPFLCEMANIREHCSWVHEKNDVTTEKAIDLVRIMVEKVKQNKALHPIKVPVTKTALVIGGGIAGIQAALDIANAGHKVIMVERSPSIGGHMSQLIRNFPDSRLLAMYSHTANG